MLSQEVWNAANVLPPRFWRPSRCRRSKVCSMTSAHWKSSDFRTFVKSKIFETKELVVPEQGTWNRRCREVRGWICWIQALPRKRNKSETAWSMAANKSAILQAGFSMMFFFRVFHEKLWTISASAVLASCSGRREVDKKSKAINWWKNCATCSHPIIHLQTPSRYLFAVMEYGSINNRLPLPYLLTLKTGDF